MSKPQTVYMVIVIVYMCLFCLFARYFYYKQYAEKRYWKHKPILDFSKVSSLAANCKKELPKFSIMIPAKNEADVIRKTLNHMSSLNYPKDRYDVYVVTDEKELLQHEKVKQQTIHSCLLKMSSNVSTTFSQEEERLLLGISSYILLQECVESCGRYIGWISKKIDDQAKLWDEVDILVSLTDAIRAPGSRLPKRMVYKTFFRIYPHLTHEEVNRIYSRYMALGLSVVCAVKNLQKDDAASQEWHKFIRKATQGGGWITEETIHQLAQLVARNITNKVHKQLSTDDFQNDLKDVYTHLFPTTQYIIEQWKCDNRGKEIPELLHFIVPNDFDGTYNGRRLGHAVKSTKGRALNFALPYLKPDTNMCGFYDAESRPDRDILLHVAYRCLKQGFNNRILQGPIFQVRNFYDMSPFSKVASLYQSIAHDWALPVTYKTIPFVGGTNVYISCDLIHKLRGYDHHILTEDLEIGTRAFLEQDVWPEYLPCATSEQTPPVFKAFYRQRLRWGTGHLQIIDKIRREDYPSEKKRALLRRLYLKGPIEWTFYQVASFLPALVFILYIVGIIDPRLAPWPVKAALFCMTITYIGFTYYCFMKYRSYLDKTSKPNTVAGRAFALAQLLYLPIAAFFFPVPFSSALVLKKFDRHPTNWTKTPRTRE